jgi:hypothetical protein
MKKLILLFLAFGMVSQSFAAITPDVLGTIQSTWATSLTYATTITAGNYLTVETSDTNISLPTVTYNGVSMGTPLVNVYNSGAGVKACIFGKSSPTTGTHNVVITSGSNVYISGISSSWNNVDSVGNTGSNTVTNGASPISYSCTTIAGQLVIDSVGDYYPGNTITQDASQTLIDKGHPGGWTALSAGASYKTAVGASTTMTWTWGAYNGYAAGACVALVPAASGPTANPFSSPGATTGGTAGDAE